MRVLSAGDVVAGRFEVVCLVARGGMGTVYRAIDHSEGTTVALKLIALPTGDKNTPSRFEREAAMLARVKHPRIVRYVARGLLDAGHGYLAMQWLDGEDLRSVLQRGPLAAADALAVLACAAEALAAVHAEGIVHRDVKPANLFLRGGTSADVVLLDFGIARPLQAAKRLTAAGTLVGTPHYMAPEQLVDGGRIGPATDVFSLGCIFYECLTGRPAFDAAHVAGVLARILYDDPASVRATRPAIPREWEDLLVRMLSRDAERRPRDGAALQNLVSALPAVTAEEHLPLSLHGPAAPLESGEQTLVTLVLATFGPPEGGDPAEAPAMETGRMEAARRALPLMGFSVEELAESSILASVASPGMVTDQARIAARGALYLRELWPDARLGVVTGRALMGRTTRTGEAAFRAMKLLEDRSHEAQEGVWLDTVTAALLDSRFVTQNKTNGTLLLAERPDEGTGRLLLGKPTPCVGREVELMELEGLLGRAIEDGEPQGVLLLGPPGTGKSRLFGELARRIRATHPETLLLVGHGDPLTAGSPYGVLRDALRRYAGLDSIEDPESARNGVLERLCEHVDTKNRRRVGEFLGELCGVPFPAEASPPLLAARNDAQVMEEQIGQAFSEWMASACAARPVTLVLEDLHWGDALTVKLVRSLLRSAGVMPLFVFCLGRPETRELFPHMASSRMHEMSLRPLGRRAIERLVKSVLGDSIAPETVERIEKLSEGNALFLEELIRAAAEGKMSEAPETVVAMLQARLSKASSPERRLLRAASVVGETFWVGAVRRIVAAWGARDDVDGWLERLVEEELATRHKESRFPREIQMGFRHALVKDAAYGLLTEADLKSAHLAAGAWLESAGETDAMALAGHAEEGGDLARAARFYANAAAESLGRNDLREAAQRAGKGLGCGAEGLLRGELCAIVALARYGLGVWPESTAPGLEALATLPKGSYWWCRTAERMIHALPQVGDIDSFLKLAEEVCQVDPPPEALPAFACAIGNLHYIATGLAPVTFAEVRRKTLARLTQLPALDEPRARGLTLMWQAHAAMYVEPHLTRNLALARRGVEVLAEGKVFHELSMGHVLVGIAAREMGDLDTAEASTREALSIAERIQDRYQTANAAFYVSETLLEWNDPSRLEEIESLARRALDAHVGAFYEGASVRVLAEIALSRGQASIAEAHARRAVTAVTEAGAEGMLVYWCVATHVRTLLACGRVGEALAIVEERLPSFLALDGAGYFDVPFRLAVAETFFAAGDPAAGRDALGEALRQIELRAGHIHDATSRSRYLAKKDNIRAFALARAWRRK
ncbi:serine/threonine-protein kinase [Polyangium sp. y55x31]|uniref:serine/threonine-protein kinase n=1 Tax=Polyangium sp. y55x31 TaxID=3042688 RepID=UPI002482763D|nr:serine/threonine-protein kinase [Polyangium sp. y55x31]MDI1475054.1 protein kinase [Polyangium sp. y55x31]